MGKKARKKLNGSFKAPVLPVVKPPVESKKVTLKSSDGMEFQVDIKVACVSAKLKALLDLEKEKDDIIIPLDEVEGLVLRDIISWCEYHQDDEEDDDDTMSDWDHEFLNKDKNAVAKLALATVYLKINGLLEIIGKTIAENIRGKTTEEMRDYFGITDPGFTPEEEEEMIIENNILQLDQNLRQILLR